EIAKLAVIGYTAFILSKQNMFTEKQMFKYILIGAGIVCGLIFTNNGSTALLLFAVVQMMMFFGQISFARLLRFWGMSLALISLLVALLYFAPAGVMDFLPERAHTWKGRIERFSDPAPSVTYEPGKAVSIDDDDYQVVHAKIAIARGGVLGQFPGHGQQRDFLPQAYSDFIYAIIIEEMGIVGGVFVLFLYIALLIRVGMIARKCDKLFPKFLVMGCGLLLVAQALTNMAVAVDLIPVTGQPLPLISRGGTSTVISCAYIGIILSVSRFGANMGNEDEDAELLAEGEKSLGIEPETDEHPLENASASVEEEVGVAEMEENPLKPIHNVKEEIITESKI
ncbi:MAG: FtsW/RodA/SpoVE family cell cycle protein, partial [Parabacteroides sp.]|nr:FtsW/RodA/SpoVE family cell cycle protein [Parabacteroides sp.]